VVVERPPRRAVPDQHNTLAAALRRELGDRGRPVLPRRASPLRPETTRRDADCARPPAGHWAFHSLRRSCLPQAPVEEDGIPELPKAICASRPLGSDQSRRPRRRRPHGGARRAPRPAPDPSRRGFLRASRWRFRARCPRLSSASRIQAEPPPQVQSSTLAQGTFVNTGSARDPLPGTKCRSARVDMGTT
jgi:hypothetical protein